MNRLSNPRTTLPVVLRRLAFVAIGAASLPVLAQSTEYRRGYDDGYRAGNAAAAQGAMRPSYGNQDQQGGRRVNVLKAVYGRGNAACDVRDVVQDIVDRQGPNRFEASNELCGDPAPNQTKVLDVTYQCGGNRPMRVVTEEGQVVRLNCR